MCRCSRTNRYVRTAISHVRAELTDLPSARGIPSVEDEKNERSDGVPGV
jgi:hypothetical protein